VLETANTYKCIELETLRSARDMFQFIAAETFFSTRTHPYYTVVRDLRKTFVVRTRREVYIDEFSYKGKRTLTVSVAKNPLPSDPHSSFAIIFNPSDGLLHLLGGEHSFSGTMLHIIVDPDTLRVKSTTAPFKVNRGYTYPCLFVIDDELVMIVRKLVSSSCTMLMMLRSGMECGLMKRY